MFACFYLISFCLVAREQHIIIWLSRLVSDWFCWMISWLRIVPFPKARLWSSLIRLVVNQISSCTTPRPKLRTPPNPCPWPCLCTLPSWSTTSLVPWSRPKRHAVQRSRTGRVPNRRTARVKRVTEESAARVSWWSSLTDRGVWGENSVLWGEMFRFLGQSAFRCRGLTDGFFFFFFLKVFI